MSSEGRRVAVLLVCVFVLGLFSCSRLTGAELDIPRICSGLRQAAHGEEISALSEMLDEMTGPKKQKRIYEDDNGYYVRLHRLFVEESGYYIAKPGVEIVASPGTDPSFKKIEDCVYEYVIKG